jgi:centrosomal protein CEP104
MAQIGVLNFRVFHASSQDSQFTANELSTNDSRDDDQASGWQSQRFCVYPQEIIVQFPSAVQISQMQLLVHETKIPRQVELYAYMPGSNASGLDFNPASALS